MNKLMTAMLALLPLACSDGDGGNGADDAAVADAADADATSCSDVEIADLCVRGDADDDGEALVAGAPVQLQMIPGGCHSSACTVVQEAGCTAELAGDVVTVDGNICIRSEGECTLPDCGGAGTAECDTGEGLAAGDYTATMGELSVSFTVPSPLPHGGVCTSSL